MGTASTMTGGCQRGREAWRDPTGLRHIRIDELPHIVTKWTEAVGKLPD